MVTTSRIVRPAGPIGLPAAAWAKSQTYFRLPIDDRPLRNKLVAKRDTDGLPRLAPLAEPSQLASPRPARNGTPVRQPRPLGVAPVAVQPDVVFLGEVVEAEVVASGTSRAIGDILFIE